MLNSFFSVWKKTDNRVGDTIFIVAVSFFAALLTSLVQDRTFVATGVGPDSSLVVILVMFLLAILFTPTSVANEGFSWRQALLPLGAVLLFPLVSVPCQIGLGLLFLTGLFGLRRSGISAAVSNRLGIAACAWFVAYAIKIAFNHVDARMESFDALATLLSSLFFCLGHPVTSAGSSIFLSIDGKSVEILCSLDKFGGSFPWVFAGALIATSFLFKVAIKQIMVWTVALVFYFVIRAATVLALISYETIDAQWWDEIFVAISFVPIVFIFCLFPHATNRERPATNVVPSFAGIRAYGWLAVGAIFVVGWNWVDLGTVKSGKVMIDEHYSRWEWSEDPLDEERYGVKTVYSYYCMAEALGEQYGQVARNFDEIDDDVLTDVSVLVLKTPTKPYSKTAIDAIHRFVERGGGVWLIGDHTDIFGMNTYLNMVGNKYGLTLYPDSVIDPNANREITKPDFAPHPIARNMGTFLWYTGDSMNAPFGIKDLINRDRMLRDRRNLAVNTYFGDFRPSLRERVGPVVQAAAITHKKGRVAVWTDSTLFSNFSIFLPGKFALADGYVNWLNRQNTHWSHLRWPIILAALALAMFLFVKYRFIKDMAWAWIGISVGVLCINHTGLRLSVNPNPDENYDVAFFEPDPQRHHLPLRIGFDDPTPNQYLTSFVAVQRTGQRPYVASTIERATRGHTMVWVRPLSIAKAEMSRLSDFLQSGGRLIVLDGGSGEPQALSDLCHLAKCSLSQIELKSAKSQSRAERPEWMDHLLEETNLQDHSVLVRLGDDVVGTDATQLCFVDAHGENSVEEIAAVEGAAIGTPKMVACRISVGAGEIILTSTCSLFSDFTLGANSSVPTNRQLALLRTLYDWYEPTDLAQPTP